MQLYSLGFLLASGNFELSERNFLDELEAVSLSLLKTYKKVVKRHAQSVKTAYLSEK